MALFYDHRLYLWPHFTTIDTIMSLILRLSVIILLMALFYIGFFLGLSESQEIWRGFGIPGKMELDSFDLFTQIDMEFNWNFRLLLLFRIS